MCHAFEDPICIIVEISELFQSFLKNAYADGFLSSWSVELCLQRAESNSKDSAEYISSLHSLHYVLSKLLFKQLDYFKRCSCDWNFTKIPDYHHVESEKYKSGTLIKWSQNLCQIFLPSSKPAFGSRRIFIQDENAGKINRIGGVPKSSEKNTALTKSIVSDKPERNSDFSIIANESLEYSDLACVSSTIPDKKLVKFSDLGISSSTTDKQVYRSKKSVKVPRSNFLYRRKSENKLNVKLTETLSNKGNKVEGKKYALDIRKLSNTSRKKRKASISKKKLNMRKKSLFLSSVALVRKNSISDVNQRENLLCLGKEIGESDELKNNCIPNSFSELKSSRSKRDFSSAVMEREMNNFEGFKNLKDRNYVTDTSLRNKEVALEVKQKNIVEKSEKSDEISQINAVQLEYLAKISQGYTEQIIVENNTELSSKNVTENTRGFVELENTKKDTDVTVKVKKKNVEKSREKNAVEAKRKKAEESGSSRIESDNEIESKVVTYNPTFQSILDSDSDDNSRTLVINEDIVSLPENDKGNDKELSFKHIKIDSLTSSNLTAAPASSLSVHAQFSLTKADGSHDSELRGNLPSTSAARFACPSVSSKHINPNLEMFRPIAAPLMSPIYPHSPVFLMIPKPGATPTPSGQTNTGSSSLISSLTASILNKFEPVVSSLSNRSNIPSPQGLYKPLGSPVGFQNSLGSPLGFQKPLGSPGFQIPLGSPVAYQRPLGSPLGFQKLFESAVGFQKPLGSPSSIHTLMTPVPSPVILQTSAAYGSVKSPIPQIQTVVPPNAPNLAQNLCPSTSLCLRNTLMSPIISSQTLFSTSNYEALKTKQTKLASTQSILAKGDDAAFKSIISPDIVAKSNLESPERSTVSCATVNFPLSVSPINIGHLPQSPSRPIICSKFSPEIQTFFNSTYERNSHIFPKMPSSPLNKLAEYKLNNSNLSFNQSFRATAAPDDLPSSDQTSIVTVVHNPKGTLYTASSFANLPSKSESETSLIFAKVKPIKIEVSSTPSSTSSLNSPMKRVSDITSMSRPIKFQRNSPTMKLFTSNIVSSNSLPTMCHSIHSSSISSPIKVLASASLLNTSVTITPSTESSKIPPSVISSINTPIKIHIPTLSSKNSLIKVSTANLILENHLTKFQVTTSSTNSSVQLAPATSSTVKSQNKVPVSSTLSLSPQMIVQTSNMSSIKPQIKEVISLTSPINPQIKKFPISTLKVATEGVPTRPLNTQLNKISTTSVNTQITKVSSTSSINSQSTKVSITSSTNSQKEVQLSTTSSAVNTQIKEVSTASSINPQIKGIYCTSANPPAKSYDSEDDDSSSSSSSSSYTSSSSDDDDRINFERRVEKAAQAAKDAAAVSDKNQENVDNISSIGFNDAGSKILNFNYPFEVFDTTIRHPDDLQAAEGLAQLGNAYNSELQEDLQLVTLKDTEKTESELSDETEAERSEKIQTKTVLSDKNVNIQKLGPGRFQCGVCEKIYGRKVRAIEHYYCHLGKKPWECDICHRKFASYSSYVRHEKLVHTPLDQREYHCSVCGKCFGIFNTLQTHMASHAELKPFACSICGQRFAQKGTRKSHETIHSGLRPWVCDFCGQSYLTKQKLTSHLRGHAGEFYCGICEITFSSQEVHSRHKRRHVQKNKINEALRNRNSYSKRKNTLLKKVSKISNTEFKCQMCNKTFSTSAELTYHLPSCHAITYCPPSNNIHQIGPPPAPIVTSSTQVHSNILPSTTHSSQTVDTGSNSQFGSTQFLSTNNQNIMQQNMIYENNAVSFSTSGLVYSTSLSGQVPSLPPIMPEQVFSSIPIIQAPNDQVMPVIHSHTFPNQGFSVIPSSQYINIPRQATVSQASQTLNANVQECSIVSTPKEHLSLDVMSSIPTTEFSTELAPQVLTIQHPQILNTLGQPGIGFPGSSSLSLSGNLVHDYGHEAISSLVHPNSEVKKNVPQYDPCVTHLNPIYLANSSHKSLIQPTYIQVEVAHVQQADLQVDVASNSIQQTILQVSEPSETVQLPDYLDEVNFNTETVQTNNSYSSCD